MKEAVTAVRTLDCLGLYCPEPMFQIRENIDRIKPGEILEVITDDPAVEEDLQRFAKPSDVKVICEAEPIAVIGEGEVEKVRVHDLRENENYELFIDAVVILE